MADMARKHGPVWYGCGCSVCANKRQRRKERKSAKLEEKREWQKDTMQWFDDDYRQYYED